MTVAEARWRAQRMQHLLEDGMERFEAMALVRQDVLKREDKARKAAAKAAAKAEKARNDKLQERLI